MIIGNYRGLQGITKGNTGLERLQSLQGVTRGNKRLQGVTRGYRGLEEVTVGYKGLQRVTRVRGGYKVLQGFTFG